MGCARRDHVAWALAAAAAAASSRARRALMGPSRDPGLALGSDAKQKQQQAAIEAVV